MHHEGRLTERIRASCRDVAAQARHVEIARQLVASYAASLPKAVGLASPEPAPEDPARRERLAAYWLTLDAINFGSGWFPTLRKSVGVSGYATIASGLRRHFERDRPWTARELIRMTPGEIAHVVGQDPDHELMALFAHSLRDLGRHVESGHDGSFLCLAAVADRSAVELVERLASWDCFADVSRYGTFEVPFLKRAQIAAADIVRAGLAQPGDLGELTMFADNVVPHVLRLDGILRFSPELVRRIDGQELLIHGSPEEVEIRASAVHAVELIAAATPEPRAAAEIDEVLWNRGQGRTYKARRRHRCRCTAY